MLNNKFLLVFSIFILLLNTPDARASEELRLMFGAGENWQKVKTISVDKKSRSLIAEGTGEIFYSNLVSTGGGPIVSTESYRDSIVKLEFLLSPGSKAGLLLLSRYEINIADNYSQHELSYSDLGGLDKGHQDNPFAGIEPLINAAKSNSEWQSLEVHFRSPRMNEAGAKIENALFLQVKINGQVVQSNTLAQSYSSGSLFTWEQPQGPLAFRLKSGAIAIRHFDIRRANFSALTLPELSGQSSNRKRLVDKVALGKKYFQGFGCIECHAQKHNDASVKSGPTLFGLFQNKPRDRIIIESGENHQFTIKADSAYLEESLRSPQVKLATKEGGSGELNSYAPVMPAYDAELLSPAQVDALESYLKTLNSYADQGAIVDLSSPKKPTKYSPELDPFQLLIAERTRIQRGPMPGTSARAIHVGLPGRVNYSFDPRSLSIVQLWQGGFLDLSGELKNRGGGGFKLGNNSQKINFAKQDYLLQPLNREGKPIDFSFKEAKFGDNQRMVESLNSSLDHLAQLNDLNANFLGYSIDSRLKDSAPQFHYKIGKNRLSSKTTISAEGRVEIILSGEFIHEQHYRLNTSVLRDLQVEGASLEKGSLRIAPGKNRRVKLLASMNLSSSPWKPEKSNFLFQQQNVQKHKVEADLANSYGIESYFPPRDNFGRPQLFEALGLAVADDGTVVVSTRTAGIWRIMGDKWHFFAEGTFDSLGLVIEDKKGLVLTVGQKGELTRIADTNGDGLADSFKTLFDGFSYHGNYHSYLHGPVKSKDNKYFVALNLAHSDLAYKAGGDYMGTFGGYRGWGFMVAEDGSYEPWINGLRSPAGLGNGPNGNLWYTENQGEYVGTSKLFQIVEKGFYGHPASLVDLPGMRPDDREISWSKVKGKRLKPTLLFPHNKLANSPGHLTWDSSKGKFGPFSGQIFVGDQTQSNLFRLALEKVNGIYQGAVIPFASGLESGLMRSVFLADGSMLIGQTGRGWQARGGKVASLQRIHYSGKQVPEEIKTVNVSPRGFEISFTQAIKPIDKNSIKIRSWVYRDASAYGSSELDVQEENIRSIKSNESATTLSFELENIHHSPVHPEQSARVYHIVLAREAVFGDVSKRKLEAFYTLNEWPR